MKKSRGQAMVEYILLLLVVIPIAMVAYQKIEGYLFNDGGFFDRYAGGLKSSFSSDGGLDLKYKRFSIRK